MSFAMQTHPGRALPRVMVALTIAALATFAAAASAQTFPSKPITLLYPSVAGGGPDIVLRAMIVGASKTLGQPIVVEARPGASGRLGVQAQKNAPGDSHMLSMLHTGNTVALPLVDPSWRIEPGKDYTPVLAIALSPFMMMVSPALGVRDMKSLIAYGRANPGKLNVGIAGSGGAQHIDSAMAFDVTGVNIVMVPYKSEVVAGPALAANEIQVVFGSTTLKSLVDAGRVVALAVASSRRLPQFPNLPTMREAGFAQLDNLGFWIGLAAPPGAQRADVARVNAAFAATLTEPEVVKVLDANVYVPLGGAPDDFTAMIRQDIERLRPVVQKLNLKME